MHEFHPCEIDRGDPVNLITLGILALGGFAACFLLYVASRREARHISYGYTQILHDALRILMFQCGLSGTFALVAMMAPCLFLTTQAFIGLYLWTSWITGAGVFAIQLMRHAPRRREVDSRAHVIPPL